MSCENTDNKNANCKHSPCKSKNTDTTINTTIHGQSRPAAAVSLLLIGALLTACGGGSDSSDTSNTPTGGESPAVLLKPVADDQELEDFIKAGFRGLNGAPSSTVGADAMQDTRVTGAETNSESSTNVQVAGVDELDHWTFNGQHFYSLGQAVSDQVSVIKPGTAPETIGQIALDFSAQGLFVDDQSMVAVGFSHTTIVPWADAYYYQETDARLSVHDIGAVTEGTESVAHRFNIELDGTVLTTRKIGDELYIVTRHTPDLEGWIDYPVSRSDESINEQVLNEAQLADFLPRMTVNGETRFLTDPKQCYLVQEAYYGFPTVTSLTRLNVRTGDFSTRCLVGEVSGLYMNQANVYLFNTSTTFGDWVTISALDDQVIPEDQTHIHRFALNDLAYTGSNVVAGQSSCTEPRFCMGELSDGALAVVTNLGDRSDPEHHLTVLSREDMTVRAQLPNNVQPAAIGKPGELLYAARILGDRAYLVTFQAVDPLYAIDLSDSSAPAILGELEVPGYSDYLHPIADDLLLGIGHDAFVDSSGFAWLQGVKVDLYDVSDMTQPLQLASFNLGKRGSNTRVSVDSHAFSAQWVGDQFRFVLPVDIADDDTGNTTPTDYATWRYSGFQAFEVDVNPDNSAQIYALPPTKLRTIENAGFTQYVTPRSTLVGDQVYLLDTAGVFVVDWNDTAHPVAVP